YIPQNRRHFSGRPDRRSRPDTLEIEFIGSAQELLSDLPFRLVVEKNAAMLFHIPDFQHNPFGVRSLEVAAQASIVAATAQSFPDRQVEGRRTGLIDRE